MHNISFIKSSEKQQYSLLLKTFYNLQICKYYILYIYTNKYYYIIYN